MADPTGIGPYLLAYSDDTLLPQSRAFTCASGSGLTTQDFGPSNNFVLNTIQALNVLNNLGTTGYLVGVGGASPYFVTRQMTSSDNSIVITHPTGVNGNTDFTVASGVSVQQINYWYNTTTPVGTGSNINLIAGNGIDITAQFNGLTGFANYTFTSSGGGGGGGDITSITSTGATLDITNPTGPAVNIDIAATNFPTSGSYLKCTQTSPLLLTWSAGASGITSLTSPLDTLNITNTGDIYHVDLIGPYTAGNVLWANGATYVPTGAPTGNPQVLTWNGSTVTWATGGGGGGGLTNVGITSGSGILIGGVAATANGNRTVDFPTPYTQGAILRGTSSGYAPLSIGDDTFVLTSDGSTFNWAPASGGTGSGGIGVLDENGELVIDDTSITDTTVIVTCGLGIVDGTDSAAGPVNVVLNPGGGFKLVGDGPGDQGKSVAYQINGGGGGAGSITSVIGANGITTTNPSGPTVTVNLPSPATGNLLVGTGSVYAPLAIAAPISGSNLILTSNGTTAAWDVNNWSTTPAINQVSIGGFAVVNCQSYQLIDDASIPGIPSAGGAITINLGILALNSSTITGTRNIVTASPTNYAATGSLLYGNGAGNYTSLVPTTNGYVLTLSSGVPTWAPGGGGGGGSVYGTGQLTTSASTLVVSVPSITSTSSVLVTGCGTSSNPPANGPFTVTIVAGTGFTIAGLTGPGSDQNKYVAYNYKV